MKGIFYLTKKELKDFFISPIAYITLLVFLVVAGIYFSVNVFVVNQADMRFMFEKLPLVFVIFVPLLTMRSWSEEKRDGTIEVLATYPIGKIGLVLSKLLATFIFILISIAFTFPFPLTLSILGSLDLGVLIASYIGACILALSYITIGQFVSINTQNQIVSAILSFVLIFILYIVGEPQFIKYIPDTWRVFFDGIGLGSHYYSISKGLLDSKDIIYYISIIFVVFFFTLKSFNRIKKIGK